MVIMFMVRNCWVLQQFVLYSDSFSECIKETSLICRKGETDHGYGPFDWHEKCLDLCLKMLIKYTHKPLYFYSSSPTDLSVMDA